MIVGTHFLSFFLFQSNIAGLFSFSLRGTFRGQNPTDFERTEEDATARMLGKMKSTQMSEKILAVLRKIT